MLTVCQPLRQVLHMYYLIEPHNGPMREALFSHFTLEETGA